MKFIDGFYGFSIIKDMIPNPCLVVNIDVVKNNLLSIVNKCQLLSMQFRPHMKTIHDANLSSILMENGIHAISVSNIDMFKQFALAGWTDISMAKVCCSDEIQQLQEYVDHGVTVSLYVDHIDQMNIINQFDGPFQICVDIDAGQNRSGIMWNYEQPIIDLMQLIFDSNHHFTGIVSHFGHLYHCETKADIIQFAGDAMMRVLTLKEHLELALKIDVPLFVGDTPSLLSMAIFDQVSEIRAGNCLLNDLQIQSKGLCELTDIGVAIKATIMSVFPDDCRVVIHCGAIHLSKERSLLNSVGYGYVAFGSEDWWDTICDGARIIELYQEHAVVSVPAHQLSLFNVGASCYIIPVHSCLAMDAMFYKQRVRYIGR